MKFLSTAIVLVMGIIVLLDLTKGDEVTVNFDSDLDGLWTNRDIWRWSDRASLLWQVPAGSDGFAVLSDSGEGDELYEPVIDIQNGLTYEIRFFFASEFHIRGFLDYLNSKHPNKYNYVLRNYYENVTNLTHFTVGLRIP